MQYSSAPIASSPKYPEATRLPSTATPAQQPPVQPVFSAVGVPTSLGGLAAPPAPDSVQNMIPLHLPQGPNLVAQLLATEGPLSSPVPEPTPPRAAAPVVNTPQRQGKQGPIPIQLSSLILQGSTQAGQPQQQQQQSSSQQSAIDSSSQLPSAASVGIAGTPSPPQTGSSPQQHVMQQQ